MSKMIFQKLSRLLKNADRFIEKRLSETPDTWVNPDIETLIGKHLVRQKASISLAESCTGGLVAHRLTNVAGSSDYFLFSGVTYSNESKINLLGVLPQTVEKYGAVHEQTAKEMAKGVLKITGATYGLSTTGIAGPSGGTKEKPVGTVCVGLATQTDVMGKRFYFPGLNRFQNKEAFASAALTFLLKVLEAK